MNIPCPSCKRQIDSNERVCPYCEWALQSAEHHPSPGGGGSLFGVLVMLIGVGFLGALMLKPELMGPLKPHALRLQKEALKIAAQLQGQKPAPKPPAKAGPIKRRVPAAERPMVINEVAEAPPPATAETAGTFTFSGEVFDLISLEPVAGAKVTLIDPATQKRVSADTGPDGRFAVDLISNMDGYDIRVRHGDYDRKYAEDWTPSMRTLSEKRRAETAAQLRLRKGERTHIFAREGEQLAKDFVLIPTSFRQP